MVGLINQIYKNNHQLKQNDIINAISFETLLEKISFFQIKKIY